MLPRRFGLKYAPIPTLALEYEEKLTIESDSQTSFYVYAENGATNAHTIRRLHVMELPMLTKSCSIDKVFEQLVKDNNRFLSPAIVNQMQLRSLLNRLIENSGHNGIEGADPNASAANDPKEPQPDGPKGAEEPKGEEESKGGEEPKGEEEPKETEGMESEEEIESEELEYFSEDASEEDSF